MNEQKSLPLIFKIWTEAHTAWEIVSNTGLCPDALECCRWLWDDQYDWIWGHCFHFTSALQAGHGLSQLSHMQVTAALNPSLPRFTEIFQKSKKNGVRLFTRAWQDRGKGFKVKESGPVNRWDSTQTLWTSTLIYQTKIKEKTIFFHQKKKLKYTMIESLTTQIKLLWMV